MDQKQAAFPEMDPRRFLSDEVFQLDNQRIFLHRTMQCFKEEHALFTPSKDSFSVVGQIVHISGAIEYFIAGLFGPFEGMTPMSSMTRGFTSLEWTPVADLDPVEHMDVESIDEALSMFDFTIRIAKNHFSDIDRKHLRAPIGENGSSYPSWFTLRDYFCIMIDHTAHHRGALAQYARLLGYEPKIPYFDMLELTHEQQLLTPNKS